MQRERFFDGRHFGNLLDLLAMARSAIGLFRTKAPSSAMELKALLLEGVQFAERLAGLTSGTTDDEIVRWVKDAVSTDWIVNALWQFWRSWDPMELPLTGEAFKQELLEIAALQGGVDGLA